MSEDRVLKMSFDPHTIEHLGVKMYSNLPNAVAELVANAYDADATEVWIKLVDDAGNKELIVSDNGIGMSFEELNDRFLRIGRNRRAEGQIKSPKGRMATGRKGLGKLAFFGIGNTIEVITTKNGDKDVVEFIMDWDSLIHTESKDYQPKFKIHQKEEEKHGTTIHLRNLKRKSAFDKEALGISLSKLFNLFDQDFKVFITLNDDEPMEVNNKLRFETLENQFEWTFPEASNMADYHYDEKDRITGKILSTEKPLPPGLRGITLFANGRLANAPEFFGASESSHGYSYFTGYLNVDFVDMWEEDVISTDRQSLNWDLPRTAELRQYLKKLMIAIEKSWREQRNEDRAKKISEKTNVDIPHWYRRLPEGIKGHVEPMIKAIVERSELSQGDQTEIVQNLHTLVPEYPYFHWRHLHKAVQEAGKEDYEREDYYRAFTEVMKRYITEVRNKSKSENAKDSGMMGEVFGRNKVLCVSGSYKKPDGSAFSPDTLDNIEEGQKFLSMGILAGGRNPVSHEEIKDLKDSKLFSEKDCLDALSLLSHLFRRLEKSIVN